MIFHFSLTDDYHSGDALFRTHLQRPIVAVGPVRHGYLYDYEHLLGVWHVLWPDQWTAN